MSQREYLEWFEYSKLEPFLADRLEFMIAKSMALGINKNIKDSSKHINPIDFLVTDSNQEEKEVKSLAEQIKETINNRKG